MKNILIVNTRTTSILLKTCSEEESSWGGRSFISHHFLKNVDPTCDPLGYKNKLIIANGLLADTTVTTAGRLSIGGKSPLTGMIKESNIGGSSGKKMARLGIKAILLEDVPDKPKLRILFIKKNNYKLIDTPDLAGVDVYKAFKILQKRFGKQVGFLCIGPAGEMGMAASMIATTDHSGQQFRVAARGGLGAIMGVKGIKAIVFDDKGTSSKKGNDHKSLISSSREVNSILRDDPKTENRHNFGTSAVLLLCNTLGILPTRNFSSGQFEKAEAISGETIAGLIESRNEEGKKGKPCVQGCVIECSNIFPDPTGKAIVASLQYESIALLGSNCGIGDINSIAELNYLCNKVGVDTIETGASLGVAMEAGILSFGDEKAAKDLVKQIGKGTPLGRIIGNGVVTTGKVFNVRRIPAVKGQAIPGYDPRSLKGIGVTYITSPMGADHTAGNALETVKKINPLKKKDQVQSSFRLQIRAAILDILGVCLFIRPAFVKKPELIADLLNARYGWNYTYSDVQNMGIGCLAAETEFNNHIGSTGNLADIPEFMRTEPLPPHNTVFDLTKKEMDKIWNIKIPSNIF